MIELLPPEVSLDVIERLPFKDLVVFSVASRAIRRLALPLLFRNFNLTRSRSWSHKQKELEWLIGAGSSVQNAIKLVTFAVAFIHLGLTLLHHRIFTISAGQSEHANQTPELLHILENLSNISELKFDEVLYDVRLSSRLSSIASALHAVRNAPLRHLSIKLGYSTIMDGPPLPGPAGLETCTIEWRLRDDMNRERAIDYLYTFIQPSLDSLYNLDILDYNDYNTRRRPSVASPILDFRALRPACHKMRRFTYRTISRDTHALAAFAEMFPHLTCLQVIFHGDRRYHWAVWTVSRFPYCPWDPVLISFQDECLVPLSLYHDLKYLTLGLDFELAEDDMLKDDHDLAWYRRCFLRRFEATKLIAKACPQLKRCRWMQQGIDSEGDEHYFQFVLEENAWDGCRVVRPIKEWWMAEEYKSEHQGDLPGGMVELTYNERARHFRSY
jgi:F-box domain